MIEPGEELANELDARSGDCSVEINRMHVWGLTHLGEVAEYTCCLCGVKAQA